MRSIGKTPEKIREKIRLMVFARAPVPGRCKTRLIRRYGARGAAQIQRRLLRAVLHTACGAGMTVDLWCEPDARHGFFLACRRHYGVALRRQHPGDLGRKMGLAIRTALREGAPRALIIGSDCVALTIKDLRAAAAQLGRYDSVLQPADDGGYVLLGARTGISSALRGIGWSSGREGAQTLARLARQGFSSAALESRWDVDRPHDLRRARRQGLLQAPWYLLPAAASH